MSEPLWTLVAAGASGCDENVAASVDDRIRALHAGEDDPVALRRPVGRLVAGAASGQPQIAAVRSYGCDMADRAGARPDGQRQPPDLLQVGALHWRRRDGRGSLSSRAGGGRFRSLMKIEPAQSKASRFPDGEKAGLDANGLTRRRCGRCRRRGSHRSRLACAERSRRSVSRR